MNKLILGVLLAGAAAGCGSNPAPNMAPMTEEEVRLMKEDDRRVDEAERSGSGTATPAPAKAKKR